MRDVERQILEAIDRLDQGLEVMRAEGEYRCSVGEPREPDDEEVDAFLGAIRAAMLRTIVEQGEQDPEVTMWRERAGIEGSKR